MAFGTKLDGNVKNISVEFLLIVFLLSTTFGTEKGGLFTGQIVYVPAYSHIYSVNRERPFLLTVTLSIRNIDQNNHITICEFDYYKTQGKIGKNVDQLK